MDANAFSCLRIVLICLVTGDRNSEQCYSTCRVAGPFVTAKFLGSINQLSCPTPDLSSLYRVPSDRVPRVNCNKNLFYLNFDLPVVRNCFGEWSLGLRILCFVRLFTLRIWQRWYSFTVCPDGSVCSICVDLSHSPGSGRWKEHLHKQKSVMVKPQTLAVGTTWN